MSFPTFGITMTLDGPLRLDWDLHINDLQRLTRAMAPKKSHALENSLTAEVYSKTLPIARIRSPLPYAFIQNFGGTIPARSALGDKPMRWLSPTYGWTSKMTVGPSVIKGSNYIERAVNAWFKLIEVKWVGDGIG